MLVGAMGCIVRVCYLICSIPMPHVLCRFSGKVEEWDGMSKHLVVYDDGDEEWVDLATDKIKLHAESGEAHKVLHELPLLLSRVL